MSDRDSQSSFADRAERFLARFEQAVDRVADDLDIDVLRAGNVVTLTFDNDHRLVVNSQAAAEEIWVAARSGGFHYRWDPDADQWRDGRSGETIDVALRRLIGLETGAVPALDL